MKGTKGFFVILPDRIIEIPLSRSLSRLRLFYALPREPAEKRPEHLDLPRNIQEVPNSEEYLIESGKDVLLPQDAFGGRGNRLSCRSRRPIRTVNTKSMESQGRSGSIRSIPMTNNVLGENQVLTGSCKRCMISMIR